MKTKLNLIKSQILSALFFTAVFLQPSWLFAKGGNKCTELFAVRMSAYPEGMIPISGYASVFGVRDSYGEITNAKTFVSAVKNFNAGNNGGQEDMDLYMFYNHNPRTHLGAWTYMEINERGLYVEGYLDPEEPSVQKMFSDWRKSPFNGLSIMGENEGSIFAPQGSEISDYTLWDISVVNRPSNRSAYFDMPDTSLTKRGIGDKFLGLLDRFLESER